MPLRSEMRSTVGAGLLVERDALGSFAGKLAPTMAPFVAQRMPRNPHIFEEKLQIPANIWYKVSRSERV